MSECMTQEDAEHMDNEQAIAILKPLRDMMRDQYGCPISDAYFAVGKAIEALSQSQRIEGRWTRKNDGVYCSACYKGWDFMTGVPAEVETEYKFCPNCGAWMRGEQDETD